jgi:tetratricopeptide (TPR) repeat protein
MGGRSEEPFSSSVGQRFHEIACELAASEGSHFARRWQNGVLEEVVPGKSQRLEQAIIFLTAALRLDSGAKYVLPDLIRFASRHPDRDYSELVYRLLEGYVDESADLEPVREAISYLLGRANAREQREELLGQMLTELGDRNKVLASELATELGLLAAEKADLQSAQSYFMHAYYNNKYNKLAFAKLAELLADQIQPAAYLEHLRFAWRQNPLDMGAALAFAQYAERLELYQTAAGTYEYCADLSKFLRLADDLPASLYIPWAISSYNTQRGRHKCLQIASDVRQSGRFDLLLEAIAGRAAMKIGSRQQADQILKAAANEALKFVSGGRQMGEEELRTADYERLAWFYCFALPDANEALEWANKAYSTEPNSATAAAILAYSLVAKGQTNWAKLLIDNYQRNQIADLTLAQIHLAGGQQGPAIETLKSAIARDPGSLAAERAKEILAQQGSDYIPPVDPDIVLTALRSTFGDGVVPMFVSPEEAISAQLKLRGRKFSYGSKFGGTVVITNNSAEPLVISDDGLFKGNIRVDAVVSGDLEEHIPNLVSVKIRPALPVESGHSVFVPVRLASGRLRQMLLAHPQASLDIEFTVLLDPVIIGRDRIGNRFDIKPASVVVKRPGIELSRKYLQNRLDSLSKGQQGQKIRTAQLFTGLLMEQSAVTDQGPLYKFMYADWMPDLLKSALVHSLADDDWVVVVHTMTMMLALPLDYELVSAVAKNLNDAPWPARLMAGYLLTKSQESGFDKVLDWTAEYDSDAHVRQMAIALGGREPKREELLQQPSPPVLE